MSDLTESEILSKYKQSLKEARDQCDHLWRQADPALISPRGWRYARLKKAVTELEGCSRQMSHYRADARWLKLGIQFAKMLQVIQRLFVGQKWLKFRDLLEVFDLHMRNCDELATNKTGRLASRGPIIPARPADFLVLPDWKAPMPPLPRMVH